MNGYPNPYNPFGFMQQQYQMPQAQTQVLPQTQVVRVSGENGAKAYQMGANSSALLLDESGSMVFLKTTDGAGFPTVSAYDITPHKTVPVPDYGSLESRIERLEMIVNGNSGNTATTGKRKSNDAENKANDEHG